MKGFSGQGSGFRKERFSKKARLTPALNCFVLNPEPRTLSKSLSSFDSGYICSSIMDPFLKDRSNPENAPSPAGWRGAFKTLRKGNESKVLQNLNQKIPWLLSLLGLNDCNIRHKVKILKTLHLFPDSRENTARDVVALKSTRGEASDPFRFIKPF